ncbi:MAG TPA: thioredoxin family protein [Anaerohalosphaeraceae bacterium]|nr:thioredoxin family protein [Anaerohalosphaeraceae bacterium]
MKHFSFVLLLLVFLCVLVVTKAEETPPASKQTVQQLYPDLTQGALSLAVLEDLPEGILLQAGSVQITLDTIAKLIDSQPASVRDEFKNNAFFLLEQEAVQRILPELAKQALASTGTEPPKEDFALMEQFFQTVVFQSLQVSEPEIKTFYEANPDLFGGASFEQVKAPLKAYLLDRKKQQAASEYIQKLGEQIPIRVSKDWLIKQAQAALENPVDKARRSGKPSLADFGADGCRPCEMMTPILETLRKKYEGKLNVVFVHIRKHPILASRYGIQAIPVQIFYDASGKEVFRHEGFFPQDEIEKKLKEIGVP